MKVILFTIIYLGHLLSCISQSRGYVRPNDSTYLTGFITLENSNPKRLIYRSTFDGEPQYYTAQNVLNFAYLTGEFYNIIDRKFLVMDIEVDGRNQKEFAQLLVQGKLRLYMVNLKKNIYLLEDQSTIQLTDENFEEIIKQFAGSCDVGDSSKFYIKHNTGSLMRFVKSLNTNKCYHYPGYVFGVVVGYNFAKVSLFKNSYIENLNDFSTNAGNIKFGLNFDFPFMKEDRFSLIGQITFDKYNFIHDGFRDLTGRLGNQSQNLGIVQHVEFDFSFLGFEIMPKYSYRVKQFSPFFMGGLASAFLLDLKSQLKKEVTQAGSVAITNKTDFLTLTNLHLGYAWGLGLQYFYKPGKYVTLELKNSKLYNTTVSRRIMTINNNYFTLKTNF